MQFQPPVDLSGSPAVFFSEFGMNEFVGDELIAV